MTNRSDAPAANVAAPPEGRIVVLGLGVASKAVVRALRSRSFDVTAIEDRPTNDTREFAAEVGATLIEAPEPAELMSILDGAGAFIPSPGVPESHPAFALVETAGIRTLSEFDLARFWDSRPIAAITGTDGKTSVTLLTVAMLNASGVSTAAVGNTDVPLIEAIDDPSYDAFVVEASSFRLGHSEHFAPVAAAWLNFSPDHLDVHASLERYELAKASIWAHLPDDAQAVAPVDDATVARHVPGNCNVTSVGLTDEGGATAFVSNGDLLVDGVNLGPVAQLHRTFDHDITNTLVAAALAFRLGATVDGITSALATFELPPHRIQHVATIADIAYFNDSKATVPHAVLTAVRSFPSVVLIAGGRNKDLDLSELGEISNLTRAVVAMGDAADEVDAAFDQTPVHRATDMADAIRRATDLAEPGDTVLLSPGCASFDAYANYKARGDDFIRVVNELAEAQ